MGGEVACFYFVDNPLAAFEGRLLPYIPEIAPPPETRRRKRFLFF